MLGLEYKDLLILVKKIIACMATVSNSPVEVSIAPKMTEIEGETSFSGKYRILSQIEMTVAKMVVYELCVATAPLAELFCVADL